jgi:hypothetical protein
MSRIIDFFSDLIWGGGNPATDTYNEDWTTPSTRNTGTRMGEVAQPREEFIASIAREQNSAAAERGGSDRGDSTASRRVATVSR